MTTPFHLNAVDAAHSGNSFWKVRQSVFSMKGITDNWSEDGGGDYDDRWKPGRRCDEFWGRLGWSESYEILKTKDEKSSFNGMAAALQNAYAFTEWQILRGSEDINIL